MLAACQALVASCRSSAAFKALSSPQLQGTCGLVITFKVQYDACRPRPAASFQASTSLFVAASLDSNLKSSSTSASCSTICFRLLSNNSDSFLFDVASWARNCFISSSGPASCFVPTTLVSICWGCYCRHHSQQPERVCDSTSGERY